MSKYKDGREDEKASNITTRRSKTSFEPVLGSSKTLGQSDSSRKSHEVNHQEKECRSARGSALSIESTSGRIHRGGEDESKNSGSGNSAAHSSEISSVKHGTGKYADEKKRSTSPETHRSLQDRDDGHKGARSSTTRNSDTNRYDRDRRRSYSRSPERRRDRKRSRSRSCERRRSRSRSHERHRSRSREREKRRIRSRSKDRRSRSRDRRSRSRDKRSRSKDRHSRSRDKRSRSKDRRRSWSKDRRFRRSRSRDRQRARSRSRTPSYCRPKPPATVGDKIPPKLDESKKIPEVEQKPIAMGHEKPSNLPLNDFSQLPKPGMMTPQMAVQQAMAAMNARAQQLTGVTLPKYYNPAAVNPLKYAEQMQKRKLLWQSNQKKVIPTPSMNNWEQTTFAQDQDGKMAAKFKKLMGIKNEAEEKATPPVGEDQLRKQEELFRTLDQQYETARMSTHSFRGVGLGFSSAATSGTIGSSQILFPK